MLLLALLFHEAPVCPAELWRDVPVDTVDLQGVPICGVSAGVRSDAPMGPVVLQHDVPMGPASLRDAPMGPAGLLPWTLCVGWRTLSGDPSKWSVDHR